MSAKLLQDEKYTIKSVSIESFRGYNKQHSFSFVDPITVFGGPNGNGKSSTLYAIEWCLFGKVEFIPSLEGRAGDEIVNQFNNEGIANVKLVLHNGKGDVEIERSKETGRRITEFTIKTKDGKFVDGEAEKKFFSIFNITLEDFVRVVYLHQDAIRALLTDDIAKRDEALDGLFGLEKMRSIVKGIPIKDIKNRIKKLETQKGKLNSKISGAIELCNADIEKLKVKAEENGLTKDELNLKYSTESAKSIIKKINLLCKDISDFSPDIINPTQIDNFKSFETKIKKTIKEIQQKNIDLDQITILNSKKLEIDSSIISIKKKGKPISELQTEIDNIVSEIGDMAEIDKQIENKTRDLKNENKKRGMLDIDSKLVTDAIQALKNSSESNCPVCKNKIDIKKTIKGLEIRSESIMTDNISEIDNKISELKNSLVQLEDTKDDLTRYTDRLKDENELKNELLGKLKKEIETKENDEAKLLTLSNKTSKKYTDELERLEKRSKDQIEQLQKIREDLDLIGIVISVMQKETDFGALNTLNPQDSQEIENINKAVNELHILEDNLNKIIKAAGKTQTNLASTIISTSQQNIEDYYSKLCMHKHYDKLRIDVKPRDVRGIVKNNYSIKAFNEKNGNETHVATRFSTGQMNCVALAVFFALTRALPVKLGFIILDDPSQNLDYEHKDSLAEIISGISNERQVFIATQDEDFQKLIKDKRDDAKFYEFTGWNDLGPILN